MVIRSNDSEINFSQGIMLMIVSSPPPSPYPNDKTKNFWAFSIIKVVFLVVPASIDKKNSSKINNKEEYKMR